MADQRPTELLKRWRGGDDVARDELLSVLYNDLRRVAASLLKGDAMRLELDPTELVNESAMRLLGLSRIDWNDRAHFMAVSANVMRRVLVDQARRHRAVKRDGHHVTLLTSLPAVARDVDLIALDEVLSQLGELSSERATIVELRFFGGMSNEEIAVALDISPSTVKRRWRVARAWLADALAKP